MRLLTTLKSAPRRFVVHVSASCAKIPAFKSRLIELMFPLGRWPIFKENVY